MEPEAEVEHTSKLEPTPKQQKLAIAKKKRAKYNPEIEKHQEEILFRYQQENWDAKRIIADIQETWGIELSQKQFFNRIAAWGGKKRASKDQWREIERQLDERESIGKSHSEARLNGNIFISGNRLRKGRSRNHFSYTEKIFAKFDSEKALQSHQGPNMPMGVSDMEKVSSEMNVLVVTPMKYEDMGLIIPSGRRELPKALLEQLPIRVANKIIEELLRSMASTSLTSGMEVSVEVFHAYSGILRVIIYRLSNNLCKAIEILSLLDRIDSLGFQQPLRKLLSIPLPSIELACYNLRNYLWLRADMESIVMLRKIYPYMFRSPYGVLREYLCIMPQNQYGTERSLRSWPGWNSKRQRQEKAIKILQSLIIFKIYPSTSLEVVTILEICQYIIEDFTLLYQLWEPSEMSPSIIESEMEGVNIRFQPLEVDRAGDLSNILDLGFRWNLAMFLLKAIVTDRKDLMGPLLEAWRRESMMNDAMDLNVLDSAAGNHTWDMIGPHEFHEIITDALAESLRAFDSLSSISDATWEYWAENLGLDVPAARNIFQGKISFIAYLASSNPDIFMSIVQVMDIAMPGSMRSKLIELVNGFCFVRPHELEWTNQLGLTACFVLPYITPSSTGTNPLPEENAMRCLDVLKRISEMDINPEETSLWRSVWAGLLSYTSEHCRRDEPGPGKCSRSKAERHRENLGATAELLRYFFEKGCSIDKDINLGFDFDEENRSSIRIQKSGSDTAGYIPRRESHELRPIEIALALPIPDLYLYLIEKGASLKDIRPGYLLPSHNGYCKLGPTEYIARGSSPGNSYPSQENDCNWEARLDIGTGNEQETPKERQNRLLDMLGSLEAQVGIEARTLAQEILQGADLEISLHAFKILVERVSMKLYRDSRTEISQWEISLIRTWYLYLVSLPILHGSAFTLRSSLKFLKPYTALISLAIRKRYFDLFAGLLVEYELVAGSGEQSILQTSDLDKWLNDAARNSKECLMILFAWASGLNLVNGVHYSGETGRTPLTSAVEESNMDTIAYLVSQGADIYHQRLDHAPSENWSLTPLETAVIYGRLDALALFLEAEPMYRDVALEIINVRGPDNLENEVVDFVNSWVPRGQSRPQDEVLKQWSLKVGL